VVYATLTNQNVNETNHIIKIILIHIITIIKIFMSMKSLAREGAQVHGLVARKLYEKGNRTRSQDHEYIRSFY
jgi:hypothetical protein